MCLLRSLWVIIIDQSRLIIANDYFGVVRGVLVEAKKFFQVLNVAEGDEAAVVAELKTEDRHI